MIRKELIESITVTVVEDDQDPEQLLLDLGTELCEQLGWKEGDVLKWTDNQDGSWTLSRAES
jgi:hypothetical protein